MYTSLYNNSGLVKNLFFAMRIPMRIVNMVEQFGVIACRIYITFMHQKKRLI